MIDGINTHYSIFNESTRAAHKYRLTKWGEEQLAVMAVPPKSNCVVDARMQR